MLYKVVVIDDEKEIKEGFARFFPWGELGFEVIKSFDGAEEAFAYIENNQVHLVVSDVMMPEVTGIDLARRVEEMESEEKPLVVLFSAYDDFEYVRQALQYSCTDYILKTLEYDELIAIFQQLKKKLDAMFSKDIKGQEQDLVIATVYKYVEENIKDANLSDAAELVYLSPSYLSRYFKQETGINFTQHINTVRMEKAGALLMNLQYRIYDISEKVGYNSPFNFTRAFKRHYGISPSEYRSQKVEDLHALQDLQSLQDDEELL